MSLVSISFGIARVSGHGNADGAHRGTRAEIAAALAAAGVQLREDERAFTVHALGKPGIGGRQRRIVAHVHAADIAGRHQSVPIHCSPPRLRHHVVRHDDKSGAAFGALDMVVDDAIDSASLPRRKYDPVRWNHDPVANGDATDSKRREQDWKTVGHVDESDEVKSAVRLTDNQRRLREIVTAGDRRADSD